MAYATFNDFRFRYQYGVTVRLQSAPQMFSLVRRTCSPKTEFNVICKQYFKFKFLNHRDCKFARGSSYDKHFICGIDGLMLVVVVVVVVVLVFLLASLFLLLMLFL